MRDCYQFKEPCLCLSSVMLRWVPAGTAALTNSRSVPGRPEMVLTSIASLYRKQARLQACACSINGTC